MATVATGAVLSLAAVATVAVLPLAAVATKAAFQFYLPLQCTHMLILVVVSAAYKSFTPSYLTSERHWKYNSKYLQGKINKVLTSNYVVVQEQHWCGNGG